MRSHVLAAAALSALAQAAVHDIKVGDGAFVFEPTSIIADVGDTVNFHYYPRNHSVVQSSFDAPCAPLANGNGIFSGFVPTAEGVADTMFQVTVKDTKPTWLYCSQARHCITGMVFAINPTAEKTIEQFTANAALAPANISPDTIQGGVRVPNKKGEPAPGTGSSTVSSAVESSTSIPVYGVSSIPVYATPSAPVYSTPSAPVYGTPSAPVYETPSVPVYGTPSVPVYGTPSVPVYGTPSAPVYETPSAPVYGTPSAPVYETPSAPVYETTAVPVYSAPSAPVYKTYTASDYYTPSAPVIETPTASVTYTPGPVYAPDTTAIWYPATTGVEQPSEIPTYAAGASSSVEYGPSYATQSPKATLTKTTDASGIQLATKTTRGVINYTGAAAPANVVYPVAMAGAAVAAVAGALL